MLSRREVILSAAKSALVSITGVPDANVYRSRVEALAKAELPSIIIEPLSDSADRQTIQRTIWTLLFQVTAYVAANIPDQQADQILSDIHSKLMNDITLNGIVDLAPESVQWGLEAGDTPRGVIVMRFSAVYQTNTLDITS